MKLNPSLKAYASNRAVARLRALCLCIVSALFLSATFAAPAANAVEPDEVLSDPVLEARARALSRQLRCVVCQSENIDDSSAPLAKDMRILVREQITAGHSDAEVLEYMRARYGDYILTKPPVQPNTILLWVMPAVVFLIAGGGAIAYLRSMRPRDT